MSTDELRGGMHDNIGSMFDRADQVGSPERIVYDLGVVMSVGDLGHRVQIRHVRVGISEGLYVNDFRVFLDSGL